MIPTAVPITIACVIPAYNREALMGRAVMSALRQERVPDEIIVVDDGSSDDTFARASEFGGIVRVVRQQNQGVAAARNRGMHESRCEWVAWLDSDDVWTPEHLAAVEKAIRATEGHAVIYFGDLRRDAGQEGGVQTQWERVGFSVGELPHQVIEDGTDLLLQAGFPLRIQACVFRRSSFQELGGFRTDMPVQEDSHAVINLGLSKPICAVNVLSTVMMDDAPSRLSAEKKVVYWRCAVLMWEDILSKVEGAGAQVVRRRLAIAWMRLGRWQVKSGRVLAASLSVLRAVAVSPRTMLDRCGLRRQ